MRAIGLDVHRDFCEVAIAEVLPAEKADVIRRLQGDGRVVAMVGDGVKDAPALAQADLGLSIGTGTDVAIEASDITLVSGDLRAAADAIRLSVFEPLGFVLRPEVGAISMAGSSVIVALNAVALKRLRLPAQPSPAQPPPSGTQGGSEQHVPAAGAAGAA